MTDGQRVGEIVEACTTDFVAQCYDLYESPSLGCLVKTRGELVSGAPAEETQIYGIVYKVLTAGMEPGRRPIARGKNEQNEEEIYRSSPQLYKLLKSEFNVLVAGYRNGDNVFQYLPPRPARIHNFVYLCTTEEVRQFARSFDFLNLIIKARADIAVEELIGASLREISRVFGDGRRDFLVRAGKELSAILARDYRQLISILKGLKCDAAG